MKIERVGENKIKVTVSLNDLEERDLDFNSFTYNSPAAQELFWDMMEQAEILFGFSASDAQLCIEATPDSDDGFIITISKIDEDGEFESIHKYIKNTFKNSDLRVKKKNHKVCSTILIYSFGEFDDLCLLCKRLASIYSGDSSIYKCKNTYYLILTRTNLSGHDSKSFEMLLSEYGDKVSNVSFYEGYIHEYGQKIIENKALDVINSYF